MKKSAKTRVIGTALNKTQRSTLELWQEHLAALARASKARTSDQQSVMPVSEQSVSIGTTGPHSYSN